jgi:hypothetical protein
MPSRNEFFAALGSLPAAIALLIALRWPEGILCHHRGSSTVGGHGAAWCAPSHTRSLSIRSNFPQRHA